MPARRPESGRGLVKPHQNVCKNCAYYWPTSKFVIPLNLCRKIMWENTYRSNKSQYPVHSENSSSLFAHLLICPVDGLKVDVAWWNHTKTFAQNCSLYSPTSKSVIPLTCVIKLCGRILIDPTKANTQCIQKKVVAYLHTFWYACQEAWNWT